jgi:predicted dehydrogenase
MWTRRQFIGASASAVIAAGTMGRGTVFGANKRVRVGVVGLNGRGQSHVGGFTDFPGSEVVALCDCDKRVLEASAKALKEKTGKKPKTFVDMRDLMESKGVDAVSFATPNHWHTLGSVWACQAGKDVYVEKPLSHEVWEGRQLAAAAKKYGRIVQHGTQNRSDPGWVRAIQRMKAGEIGEVYMARGLCYKRRDSIGFQPPEPPPDWLDWNLWQGPAQERPFCKNYVHYNWHWFWDYGNGDIGNQGVHQMDVAVWGLGKGFPVRVGCAGGRFGYKDQGETANTQICTFTYADGALLVFEVRGRATNDEAGEKVGNLFYGSEGYMAGEKLFDKDGKEIPDKEKLSPADLGVTGNHYETFVKAVVSRKQEEGRGTALDGHIAASHCHLGNIAYRLGRDLRIDPDKELFVGEGAGEANVMLKRVYRKGFEVPELA